MAYVYRHIRLDENVPFYIGIGNDASFSRSRERCRRSELWAKFVEGSLRYAKSQIKKVLCIDTGMIFESATDASIYFGINRNTIVRQINGTRKNKFNLTYIK